MTRTTYACFFSARERAFLRHGLQGRGVLCQRGEIEHQAIVRNRSAAEFGIEPNERASRFERLADASAKCGVPAGFRLRAGALLTVENAERLQFVERVIERDAARFEAGLRANVLARPLGQLFDDGQSLWAADGGDREGAIEADVGPARSLLSESLDDAFDRVLIGGALQQRSQMTEGRPTFVFGQIREQHVANAGCCQANERCQHSVPFAAERPLTRREQLPQSWNARLIRALGQKGDGELTARLDIQQGIEELEQLVDRARQMSRA